MIVAAAQRMITSSLSKSRVRRITAWCPTWTLACVVLSVSWSSRLTAAVDQNPENPPAAIVEEELLEADQLAFAIALEQAALDEDREAWNDLMDWSRMVDLVMTGEKSEALDKIRASFKFGFLQRMADPTKDGFVDQIIKCCEGGGSLKFLRLARADNQPIAVFRLLQADGGGVNYHQYFLRRSEDGRVRAEDIYVFLSAERLTDSFRVFWRSIAAEASKTFLDRLFKPADPVLQALPAITEMRTLMASNENEKALEVYRRLPEKARAEKMISLMRMRAAALISDEEYAEAIEHYRKTFPGDAALDFLLIDGYFLKKDYEKMLECIDRTAKNVGGDAWLMSLRAQTLAFLDRFDEARDVANEAIQAEPDLHESYWRAVTISLMAKDFEETAKLLTMVEQDLGIEVGDLTEIPEYADFVESPQYKSWMESR